MFVVGLTGGIGSGKTAASDHLATHGIAVVDADVAARQVVAPGQPALARIAEMFGRQLLLADGSLDRRALREIVFGNPEQLRRLEAITHPAIEAELQRQLQAAASPYAVLVSPLLLETRQHRMAQRILLIDAPETLQLERASQRDNSSPTQIQAIIAQQMARAEKRKRAHDILLNDGSLAHLAEALDNLHQTYLALARQTENKHGN